ncbi:MAG: carbohydrate-binding family 9-like protein [Terriglobales bacterium]
MMAQTTLAQTIRARRIAGEIPLDARNPAPEWSSAFPVTFCADWRGRNPDPARQTEVRVLWTPHTLYLRFICRYRELFLFDDSDPNGRRDQLWDRDVAEAFLQPDPLRPRHYKEFEVSPNGMWIDLDIGPLSELPHGDLPSDSRSASPRNLQSGMRRLVWLNQAEQIWTAELAIPMKALTANFDPAAPWRANFYRVEGKREPRFYSAWHPTKTPQPNFHVPEAFGYLRFA